MKKAIVVAGLCAAVTFSAPLALAQGFQPAPAEGAQAVPPGNGAPSTLGLGQLQQQLLEQARQQFMSMTPEQQQQVLDAAKQKAESLTPEQRQQIMDAAKQQMDSITPEQRQQLIEEAKQKFESLTPEQRAQLKEQALQALQKIPVEGQPKAAVNTGEEGTPADADQPPKDQEAGDGQDPQPPADQ